jgi:hypothetical protein|tara:strand:+ start:1809 stop:2441 length:633 start_codon:yes stop_codon:yes gene_type:complete
MQIEYAEIIKWFRYNHPDKLERLLDSLSPNQLLCKQWLIDSLHKVQIPQGADDKFRIEIIGGWFGYPLIDLLYQSFGSYIREIDIFEIDEFACKAIRRYSHAFEHYNIKVFNQDYFTYQKKRRTHMVINTSCEHMWDMSMMKECYESPERTLLVLQSNNKTNEPDHVNCVTSCQELIEKNELKEVFGDWKRMNDGTPDKYIRYMVMGKWK